MLRDSPRAFNITYIVRTNICEPSQGGSLRSSSGGDGRDEQPQLLELHRDLLQ